MSELPDNLCIIPFIHLASKPDGRVRYCCWTESELKNAVILHDDNDTPYYLSEDVDNIWNSTSIRNLRKQFLNNERPEICELCWKCEDSGKVSKRQLELDHNQHHYYRIQQAIENDGVVNDSPVYLDLRFGNKCNLKCRMCDPLFSTLIANERESWDDSFFAKNLQAPSHLNINGWYETDGFNTNINKLIPYMEYIYITGGEPSIIEEVKTLMQKCVDTKHSEHIELRFSTNFITYRDSFYNMFKHFKHVHVYLSLDDFGPRLKYQRHPASWDKILSNFKKSQQLPTNVTIDITASVSIYNIMYFVDIYDEFQKHFSNNHITFNSVFDPNYLSYNILTPELKENVNNALSKFLLRNNLPDSIIHDVNAISELMNITPDDIKQRQQEFRTYTKYLDKIRDEDFISTFPKLASMMLEL